MRIVSIDNPSGYSGIGGADVVVVVAAGVKVAETVTGLLGIEKVQGLLEGPPEHDAPVTLQLENCQPELGVACTVCDEPTVSLQPLGLGQFGEMEPDPASTPVTNV
jgi:hypothetical protein